MTSPRHEWQGFLRSPRWFCGNLWVPPTTALLQRRTTLEALLSGYPPVGLLDAKSVYHAEEKGNRLPRPEHRGLRSPWGHRDLRPPASAGLLCARSTSVPLEGQGLKPRCSRHRSIADPAPEDKNLRRKAGSEQWRKS